MISGVTALQNANDCEKFTSHVAKSACLITTSSDQV